MNINNKVIDNHLKFESERFRNECFNIYKTLVDGNIKTAIQNSYDELYKKIDSELKNNIMKSIGGKDLYDYSEIPGIKIRFCNWPGCCNENPIRKKIESLDGLCGNCKENPLDDYLQLFLKISNDFYCIGLGKTIKTNIDNFQKYINNEYLVTKYKNIYSFQHGEVFQKIIVIFITNFGRFIKFSIKSNNNGGNEVECLYGAFDFWIPTDYIRILQLTKPDNIEEVLKCIKDTLYNRKIVPLYVKEIVERNAVLESKYEEYKKGNEKYIKDKDEFEKETKPYIDLYKEKENLHKLREELKLEKERLKLVAIKIEMDKKKFEQDMAIIKDMNISDILNK